MKKTVGAIILIALVFAAGQAYGSGTSLIGKKVSKEMAISFNGVEVGKVIVVEGRSYVPVRDFANALELGIAVDKESVDLSGNVITDDSVELAALNKQKADLEVRIEGLNISIDSYKEVRIPNTELRVQLAEEVSKEGIQKQLDKFILELAQKETLLLELQSMLDDVNVQIAALQQ